MMGFKEFTQLNENKPTDTPLTDEINSVGIDKLEKTEERLFNKTYRIIKGMTKDGREFTVTPEIITTRKKSKKNVIDVNQYEIIVEVKIENPESTSPMSKFRRETIEFGKVTDKKDNWNDLLNKKIKKMSDWISKNFDGVRVTDSELTRSHG